MKFIYFSLFFLAFVSFSIAQKWSWSKNLNFNTNAPNGNSLAADSIGNFYLSVNQGTIGACIAKYDLQGNETWRRCFTGNINISEVTYSKNNNICLTGSFTGNALIGKPISSSGLNDIFLASFASDGNFNWIKTMGGTQDDFGNGICTDNNSNIYVTGKYSGSAVFGTNTLNCVGITNMFIAKFNPTGKIQFIKSTKDTTEAYSFGVGGYKVKANNDGNVYVIGEFYGIKMQLDTFHLYNGPVGWGSEFLCKIDSTGNTQWLKMIDDFSFLKTMTLDKDQNIVIAGYSATSHMEWATTRNYNPSGVLNWNNVFSGFCWEDDFNVQGVISRNFNSYNVGTGRGIYCGTSSVYNCLYLSKCDSIGKTTWVDTIKINGNYLIHDVSNTAIISDLQGGFIISGTTSGNFKLGNDSIYATNGNVFIARFKDVPDLPTAIPETENSKEIFNVFPNPTSANIIILYDNPRVNSFGVEIKNTIGETIYHKSYTSPRSSIIEEVDLSKNFKGVYFIEILTSDKKIIKRIILN